MSISPRACPFTSNRLLGISWVLFATAASGCSTARYLTQATVGQLAMLNHARPIGDVVRDPRTPPHIRDILAEISTIKGFGEGQGLKPTSNYTEYVKLDRPAAVWVVSACEPLEFKSREWKFPIVGSFPYLGWFDLEQAKRYAQELRADHAADDSARAGAPLDVDVRGASAYSTLGWFRDAILSSMIPEGEQAIGDVTNVVIHESVHATVYISGQAYFNESVASFVADRLTESYLDRRPQAKPVQAAEIATHAAAFKASSFGAHPAHADAKVVSRERMVYLQQIADSEDRRKRLHETYEQLKKLYSSDQAPVAKLAEKNRILAALKTELGFKRDLNNATLIQFKTYYTGNSEFESLWQACGADSRRFMKAVGSLKESSFQKPQQEGLGPVLAPLATSSCAADK